jgi:hypothetical protein
MGKKTRLLFAVVLVFGIGCFAGRRYHAQERHDAAWEAGNENGWNSGVKYMSDVEESQQAVRKEMGEAESAQHHYEFKQDGATIYRFDTDTGDACWVQISVADRNTPMSRCTQ